MPSTAPVANGETHTGHSFRVEETCDAVVYCCGAIPTPMDNLIHLSHGMSCCYHQPIELRSPRATLEDISGSSVFDATPVAAVESGVRVVRGKQGVIIHTLDKLVDPKYTASLLQRCNADILQEAQRNHAFMHESSEEAAGDQISVNQSAGIDDETKNVLDAKEGDLAVGCCLGCGGQ